MLRSILSLLRSSPRWRNIGLPVAIVAVLSLIAGITVSAVLRNTGTLEQRAFRLISMAEYAAAEPLLWQVLQSGDADLETVILFIDNHWAVRETVAFEVEATGMRSAQPMISDREIEEFLTHSGLSDTQSFLARFWWRVNTGTAGADLERVRELSRTRPPARWANHLLGRLLLMTDDRLSAAEHFAREGLSFPDEAADDLERALGLWMAAGRWEEVRKRLDDPQWREAVSAGIRLSVAEHDGDWASVLRWLWPSSLAGGHLWPWALAAVSAVLWFLLAARMGQMGSGVPGRKALYVTAFGLGVLSIYPTLVLIVIEESVFNLAPNGQPLIDAVYYIVGVGLREELCKLLLFLPLYPVLRTRGSRLEAMVCGALVGLGFAAEENIGYFHSMDVSTALARFLTANFLHMALTALVAVAVYDGNSARKGEDFSTVFSLAVVIHGAYDFFLASPAFAGEFSFLSMVVFILLSQRFLRELKLVRPTSRSYGLLRQFLLSLTALAGVSYVYASTLVGPAAAFSLIGNGLFGLAILMIMFVRELEDA